MGRDFMNSPWLPIGGSRHHHHRSGDRGRLSDGHVSAECSRLNAALPAAMSGPPAAEGAALHTDSTVAALSITLAIQNNDLPEILGVVMLTAFFVVIANLTVDILYAVIDPRVTY
jgi:hypothetical protein